MFSPKIYACVCSGRRLSISLIGNQTNTTPPLMDNTYPLLTQITEQRFKSWPENRTTVVRWTDVCLVSIKEAGHHLIRPDFQLISCKRYLILGKSETNHSFDDVNRTKRNWRLLLHLSRVGFAATTILLTRPGVRPTVHLHPRHPSPSNVRQLNQTFPTLLHPSPPVPLSGGSIIPPTQGCPYLRVRFPHQRWARCGCTPTLHCRIGCCDSEFFLFLLCLLPARDF